MTMRCDWLAASDISTFSYCNARDTRRARLSRLMGWIVLFRENIIDERDARRRIRHKLPR